MDRSLLKNMERFTLAMYLFIPYIQLRRFSKLFFSEHARLNCFASDLPNQISTFLH